MKKLKLQGKDLRKIGFKEGRAVGLAIDVMHRNYKHTSKEEALKILSKVLASPQTYLENEELKKVADALIEKPKPVTFDIDIKPQKLDYNIFGAEHIEQGALTQMDTAMRLPVAVAGALMPDAHQGYGLPIGGVLATENAVIPYGVGVDIGCRMCLSIFDLPETYLNENHSKLKQQLNNNTLFGAGKEFAKPIDDEVLTRKEFKELRLLKELHPKAVKQIGSSGSGNHFVEFGIVEITDQKNTLGVAPGKYLAILSHSGSRGLGASIANHYTQVAMNRCKLPPEAKHLAWLDLNSEEGIEYWLAMNLAGDYASACHHQIHRKLSDAIGIRPIARVENHHNFAWKEKHNGKEVIVHRKGATPAGKGDLGIIPGSMTAPGYIVMGKGEEASLSSASHGAGRRMSRNQAKKSITDKQLKDILTKRGITLIGGGLDEAPIAYKDIETVMKSQLHLVDVLGKFYPKIVKMDS